MSDTTATQSSPDVAAFLTTLDPANRADSEALIAIGQTVTGESAAMWGKSMIGFGSYHYRYATGREGDMPLVGFAPRAKAFTVYLCDGPIETFRDQLDRLGKHRTGVGCLYINRLSDVDQAVLAELLASSIVALRAETPSRPAETGNPDHVAPGGVRLCSVRPTSRPVPGQVPSWSRPGAAIG